MRKTKNKEGEHSLIGFIALCQSRSSSVLQTKRGILRHPASVLAPESALGSLPSVALSSAQAGAIIVGTTTPMSENPPCHRSSRLPIEEVFSLATTVYELTQPKTCLPHRRQRSKKLPSRTRCLMAGFGWPQMAGFEVATEDQRR